MYKNILVAVDLEKDNTSVINKAVSIAKISNAKINVVYVSQMVVIDSTIDLGASVITPGDNETSHKQLQLIVESIKEQGIEASGSVKSGLKIANTVVDDLYEELNYDLVICGSNNKTEFSEIFLGSVSAKIADKAKTDVFIVKS